MLFAPRRQGPVLPLRVIFSVPVALVLFLFYMVGSAFFYGFYKPHFYLRKAGYGGIGDVLIVTCFSCFYFLALVSYVRCVLTHPGVPADNTEEGEKAALETSKRFCRACRVLKPDRAHHCRICNTCILTMDHHCPWVANCVGFQNYKFFYLFVLHGFMGSTIVAVLNLFLRHGDMERAGVKQNSQFFATFGMIIASAMSVSLGLFTALHSYLIGIETSTIELHMYGCKRFPYSHGLYRNVQSKLGESPFLWFLPISAVTREKLEENQSRVSILTTGQDGRGGPPSSPTVSGRYTDAETPEDVRVEIGEGHPGGFGNVEMKSTPTKTIA
mgnify:CR=1 FL=1|jgi:hypothetical protein